MVAVQLPSLQLKYRVQFLLHFEQGWLFHFVHGALKVGGGSLNSHQCNSEILASGAQSRDVQKSPGFVMLERLGAALSC